MIQIIAGTFGYYNGRKVVPITNADGPQKFDPELEARLVKQGVAKYVDEQPEAPAPAVKPITDLPAFYADLVNSDRYLPVSAISNTMRDAMLARGLVTAERLRERGVR